MSILVSLGLANAYSYTVEDQELIDSLEIAIDQLHESDSDRLEQIVMSVEDILPQYESESREWHILNYIVSYGGSLFKGYDFALESMAISCGWECFSVVVCGEGDFDGVDDLLDVSIDIQNNKATKVAIAPVYSDGRCHSFNFDFDEDLDLQDAGIYDVTVYVDPYDSFEEIDETNNLVTGELPLDPHSGRNSSIWFEK